MRIDRVDESTVVVTTNCCKTEIPVPFTLEQEKQRNAGAYIKVVAPSLSAAQRELLISGYCGPCFGALFADKEEDE